MEKDFSGKKGTVKYVWDNGSEYSSEGTIVFGQSGVFLKDSDDESFAGHVIFFPYERVITVTF